MFKIYGKESCAPCRTVKLLLDRKDIPYEYKDVEKDTEALDEMIGRYGTMSVPVVVYKGRAMYGYNSRVLSEMIEEYTNNK